MKLLKFVKSETNSNVVMNNRLLKEFYKRASCEEIGSIDDELEIGCLFAGREIDGENETTILPLNEFMPKFDTISLHNLGGDGDKIYKILWLIDMTINYNDWYRFVDLTNNISSVFVCECRNLQTGFRNIIPIFNIGKLIRGSWEYSIDSYNIMTNFKWGSMKTFVGKDICKIRIRIEDVVV